MIDTDKHEKKLKEYKFRKDQLMIYTDRSEKHPYGAYKFRQKDWQTRRFIQDAKEAGWTLSSMKEIYDEAMEEVKRLHEQIVDMIDSMDNYYIRDIQHATGCLRDMIGYYEDEEE